MSLSFRFCSIKLICCSVIFMHKLGHTIIHAASKMWTIYLWMYGSSVVCPTEVFLVIFTSTELCLGKLAVGVPQKRQCNYAGCTLSISSQLEFTQLSLSLLGAEMRLSHRSESYLGQVVPNAQNNRFVNYVLGSSPWGSASSQVSNQGCADDTKLGLVSMKGGWDHAQNEGYNWDQTNEHRG